MNYKDMFLNQIKNENTKKSYKNLFFKIRKLENALNKKVSKVYIYSTHLNKELLEKM